MVELNNDSQLVQFWFEQQLRERRTLRRREWVLQEVQKLVHGGDRILNLGCGVGSYSHLLERAIDNIKVVSLDISNGCLRMGREHYNISLPVAANAIYIPFKGSSFDLVILSEVIEHIIEQDQLVAEISRIAKSGGYLVLTTSPLKSDILFSVVQKIKVKGLFGLHVEKEHIAVQHPADIVRRLESAGFSIVKQRYWNILHLRSMSRLMDTPFLGTLIEQVDNRLGWITRLCTDYACLARKKPCT